MTTTELQTKIESMPIKDIAAWIEANYQPSQHQHPDKSEWNNDKVIDFVPNQFSEVSTLSDEDRLEPIQNALFATQRFMIDECINIAEDILESMKDANFIMMCDKMNGKQ
jgi:hypothetical protein